MKILIYDDMPQNLLVAQQQLGDQHELTVIGEYKEALRQLFSIMRNELEQYDVVMTDLLAPATAEKQTIKSGPYSKVGQEMGFGAVVALYAISIGVPTVALVTNQNHHDHPLSAAFDVFGCRPIEFNKNGIIDLSSERTNYSSEKFGIKLLCTNDVGSVYRDEVTGQLLSWEEINNNPTYPEFWLDLDTGKEVPDRSITDDEERHADGSWRRIDLCRRGVVKCKNWKSILDRLTGSEQPQE